MKTNGWIVASVLCVLAGCFAADDADPSDTDIGSVVHAQEEPSW